MKTCITLLKHVKQMDFFRKREFFITAISYFFNALVLYLNIFIFEIFLDTVISSNKMNMLDMFLKKFCLFVISCTLVQVFDGLNVIMLNRYMKSCVEYFHEKFLNKMARISLGYYDDKDFIDLSNAALNGVNATSLSIIMVLSLCMFYVPYLLLVVFFLFDKSWSFVLVLPVIIVLIFLSHVIRNNYFNRFENEYADERSVRDYFLNLVADNRLYMEMRFNNYDEFISSKTKRYNNSFSLKRKKLETELVKKDVLLNIMSSSGYVFSIIILVLNTFGGDISLAEFATVLMLINKLFSMVEQSINSEWQTIFDNSVLIDIFDKFLNDEKYCEYKTDFGYAIDNNKKFTINLENVSYKYPNTNENVLNGISIEITSGERIAIVGPNGAGKTTLAKVLLGLYKPLQGTMHAFQDNKEVLVKKTASFQDFVRYKFTLFDNIAISNEDLTFRAAENLMDRISEKEKCRLELNRMMSSEFDGIELSSGMWQKIVLARAICKEYNLIVLDEPTASLDPLEEEKHYRLVNDLIDSNAIVIFVTHRLASVKISTKILYMEDGKIVEQGTHEDLIQQGGKYASMYFKQQTKYE